MTNVIRYEIKKVFARNGGAVSVLIIAALLALTCWLAISGASEWTNENGDTERGYQAMMKKREAQKAWAGPLTEEKIRRVIEENLRITATPEYHSEDVRQSNIAYGWGQGIQEIRNLLNVSYSGGFREYDYYRANSLTPDKAQDFYQNRVKLLKEWLSDDSGEAYYRYSDAEKAYLIRQYEAIETPFYYDYSQGWISAMEYFPTICMILLMVLGYLTAGIFSNEFLWKSDSVFFSSACGRDKAIRAKLIAGFLITAAVYWATVLIYSLIVLGFLGFDGASCPLQSYWGYWKCFYNLTNARAYLLVLTGGCVGCLFIAFLTMLVSAKSRSTVLGVMVPVTLIFLPNFVENMDFDSALADKLLSLLPDRLLQMNRTICYFDLFDLGGNVIGAVPVVVSLYLALSLLLPFVIYKEYRKKEIM